MLHRPYGAVFARVKPDLVKRNTLETQLERRGVVLELKGPCIPELGIRVQEVIP